jgi:hypothetical protein
MAHGCYSLPSYVISLRLVLTVPRRLLLDMTMAMATTTLAIFTE